MVTKDFKPLNSKDFLEVIDRTPLVSIDLIIQDSGGRVLMGQRVNEPAKGKWFVPGGRICKNETLSMAFERIVFNEVGVRCPFSKAKLIGAFTHLYEANAFEVPGISTHYVVLGYQFSVEADISLKKNAQHNGFKWFSKEDVEEGIHENSLEYFKYV